MKRFTKIRGSLAVSLVLMLLLSACSTTAHLPDNSLYERLGGKESIAAVVNHLWGVVSTDKRINHYFVDTKPEIFGGKLVDFLCEGSGGPCVYQGANMQQAHKGMMITSDEFDALAEGVIQSLEHFNVPPRETNEVMTMLGGMKLAVIKL